MNHLIESIVNKDHTTSKELFEQYMNQLMNEKLDEVKKMIAARIDEQITVNKDGKVHTAAGEEILPSVYRARRQLAEGKWSKKVQPGDKPSVVKVKKEKANPPLPPGKQAAKEKAETLRLKRAESAQRTAERKKAAEEEAERKAEEAKMAEMKRKAEEIAKAAGVSVKQASQVLKGEKISTTKPKMTDDDYAENIRKNPPRAVGEKDKPAKKRGLLKRIFGIKEEALARAKAIVEAKKENPIDPRTGKRFKYKPERIRPEEIKKKEYPDDTPPYTEEDRKRDVAAALRQIPKNPPPPLSDHERQVLAALREIPPHYYKKNKK